MQGRQETVAIAGGGTAGHVITGLAVAEGLHALPDPPSVLFLGTPEGLETTLVPPTGLPLVLVPGHPMAGEGWLGRIRAVLDMVRGAVAARRVLRERGVDMVLGLGGYASAGALVAGRSLGLPVAIHEANARPGITHRWLGRLARRVYLTFPATAECFGTASTLVTGTPLTRAQAEATRGERGQRAVRRMVVTGGSWGSPFLDEVAPELFSRVSSEGIELEVIHQTGSADPRPVRGRYAAAGIDAVVQPFFDDLSGLFREADFALTCGGARTLAEISQAGVPALVVPMAAAAGDHQRANARAFADSTQAWWVGEDEWDGEEIAHRLRVLLRSPEAAELAAKRMHAFARADAASAIAADCRRLIRS